MIASLIFVITVAALLQFIVSYCRSVIAAYSKVELSEQVREVTGIGSGSHGVKGEEFTRLLQLVNLCPERGDDHLEIRAVDTYYGLLGFLGALFGHVSPKVADWADHERSTCAYFAAVALDRRIAYSRDLLAQQLADRA